jgi:hypothetical protein
MKKTSLMILFLCMIVCLPAFAQTTARPVGEPDAAKVGIDTAQQHLKDVTVSKFEDASFWKVSMWEDQGFLISRRLVGVPAAKADLDAERLADEELIGIPEGSHVLGVRVDFNKRGMNQFYVYPMRPLAIEGICKTLSVWVVGRNFKHVLKIMLSDYFGNYVELTFGKLNFTGWKKLTLAVPPSITQTDYHYTTRNGLKFLGFKIETDLEESFGRYYIYFDDLSAVTDLFLESNLDPDDMQDIW